MANVPPDELYQRSREDLLPYEDARFNSLIQGVANFYLTSNDQSTWGNILRAIAIELARLEYSYAYDLVNKNPIFLTPPDIRRRWADPLYVSSNWPSPTQFDTDFKTMLVDLIAAYRLGSTVTSIQDVIHAYTGKNIIVQELYKEIGTFFDQSDRNAIRVSVNVGGTDPLTDITSLNQLQQITQSLYGAIDLAKPAHVGLEFTTVFGTDENLDCLLSPQFLTDQMFQALTPVQQGYYHTTGYGLINPPLFWKKNTQFFVGFVLVDSNGNIQLVTSTTGDSTSGSSVPGWSMVSGGITVDNNVTWTNISPAVSLISYASGILTVTANNTVLPGQSVIFVNLGNALWLNSTLPGIRKQATVLTSSPTGFTASFIDQAFLSEVEVDITGTILTITAANDFQSGMTVTFSNMQFATFLNNVTVTVATASPTQFTATVVMATYPPAADSGTVTLTTYPSTAETQGTVAYVPASTINAAQFAALSTQFQALYQKLYTNQNCADLQPSQPWFHPGIDDVLRIIIQEIEQPPFDQMLIQAPVFDPTNPTTTVAAWGRKLSPTLSPANWSAQPVIQFTVTNTVSDGINATYTYTALTNGVLTPPILQLHEGELVTISGCTGALNGTARIKNVTATTFQIPNTLTLTSTVQVAFGNVAPTLQSGYQLSFGQYVLLQAPPLFTANPSNMPAAPTLTIPTAWVQIIDKSSGLPTGEIANWDSTHPAGLVAPRLDQVWEISGGDADFIFGLT